MRQWIRLYPVSSYYVLAYAISWAIAVPLALQARGIIATDFPLALHYLSAYGPALAALTITRVLRRPNDDARSASATAPSVDRSKWLLIGALSPLLLFALAQVVATGVGQQVPTWVQLGQINFLPDLGLAAWLLWFLTSGLGEELGWRGFALPRLQHDHSAFVSSCLVAVGWAGWHLPAFFYLPSYAALGVRIIPGFALGILAGAIVLTWLYNSSSGSVLAVALWHASFNFISASPNASGSVAAIASTLIMLWAVIVLLRYGGGSLAAIPRQVAVPGGLGTANT